jgi:hypothetical protein
MGLTIYWTDFSEKELQTIFSYKQEKITIQIAPEITEGVVKEIDIFENNLCIVQKEAFLKDRKNEFRYLIHGNYKAINRINLDKNQIEIWDVFNCRQEPLKIKRAQ